MSTSASYAVGGRLCVLRPLVSLGIVLLGGLSMRCQSSGTNTADRYHYTQLHLGVQVRIVLYAQKEADAKSAASAAFARIAALEDIFSDYRTHSEIRRLTRSATPVVVSRPLFTLLSHAQRLSRETDGAFDITVGPYVDLWRTSRKSGRLPHSDSLKNAATRVGWQLIELEEVSRSVRLLGRNMLLDAGGIAKGYILDEAMAVLREHGAGNALIEAGGDIVVSGPPPGRDGWLVDVPNAPGEAAISAAARALSHAAIATSGDTEQFVEIDGTRYSHVVDPETGLGLQQRRMVTVIAPDGVSADGYATALTVLPPDSAEALLARHPELIAYVRTAQD